MLASSAVPSGAYCGNVLLPACGRWVNRFGPFRRHSTPPNPRCRRIVRGYSLCGALQQRYFLFVHSLLERVLLRYRNPEGDHAARLIDSCGLKGLERGGARVSEKHANFIVNPKGAARAADIEWLIETVRATVREKAGIDLQPEVRIVGEGA